MAEQGRGEVGSFHTCFVFLLTLSHSNFSLEIYGLFGFIGLGVACVTLSLTKRKDYMGPEREVRHQTMC